MSPSKTVISRPVLTVRVHAGLNAASLLAGLFAVGGMGLFSTANDLLKLRFPETQASLDVHPLSVNGIAGVTARFKAPVEGHVHRTPGDILHYYATASNLSEAALEVAHRIWHNVASAEARVHNSPLESVHFHEVGRISRRYGALRPWRSPQPGSGNACSARRRSRASLQRNRRNSDTYRSSHPQRTRRTVRPLAGDAC